MAMMIGNDCSKSYSNETLFLFKIPVVLRLSRHSAELEPVELVNYSSLYSTKISIVSKCTESKFLIILVAYTRFHLSTDQSNSVYIYFMIVSDIDLEQFRSFIESLIGISITVRYLIK